MGFFDRFKSKFARADQVSKPKPVKSAVKEAKMVSSVAETALATTTTPVANRTLLKPLVTEKTATLAAAGKYVFVVQSYSTKLEVKQAVRELYGTLLRAVQMINQDGKIVRFGARSGKRKDWKKAMVTMPRGKTLPIYE